jgi:hypothetical protein
VIIKKILLIFDIRTKYPDIEYGRHLCSSGYWISGYGPKWPFDNLTRPVIGLWLYILQRTDKKSSVKWNKAGYHQFPELHRVLTLLVKKYQLLNFKTIQKLKALKQNQVSNWWWQLRLRNVDWPPMLDNVGI